MSVARILCCLAVAAGVQLGCASPSPATQEPGSGSPPGSAVTSPVFSSDACDKDEDCAPVAQCHPDRCAKVENAGTMPGDMMCTMECRPGTVDCGFNHCGCAPSPSGDKVCALLPGPTGR